jgi:hypothetical protein
MNVVDVTGMINGKKSLQGYAMIPPGSSLPTIEGRYERLCLEISALASTNSHSSPGSAPSQASGLQAPIAAHTAEDRLASCTHVGGGGSWSPSPTVAGAARIEADEAIRTPSSGVCRSTADMDLINDMFQRQV